MTEDWHSVKKAARKLNCQPLQDTSNVAVNQGYTASLVPDATKMKDLRSSSKQQC